VNMDNVPFITHNCLPSSLFTPSTNIKNSHKYIVPKFNENIKFYLNLVGLSLWIFKSNITIG
jgi:hypothetical protein